jgi:type IV pilus assembly protein PilN
VRNLERSKRFLAPRLTGEATQTKESGAQSNSFAANNGAPPGVEFEILANYNPLPPGEPYGDQRAEKREKSAAAHTAVPSGRHHGVKPSPAMGAKPFPKMGKGGAR